jgi:hypothetical protein
VSKQRLTPWQRITRAGRRGAGLRLTADDVARLCHDDAFALHDVRDDAADLMREAPAFKQAVRDDGPSMADELFDIMSEFDEGWEP